jgi:hypothetical protein
MTRDVSHGKNNFTNPMPPPPPLTLRYAFQRLQTFLFMFFIVNKALKYLGGRLPSCCVAWYALRNPSMGNIKFSCYLNGANGGIFRIP